VRWLSAILSGCLLIPAPALGGELTNPDGIPLSALGGLIIIREWDRCTFSLGGALFPRSVRFRQATPDGPITTRFTLPANFQGSAPGLFWEMVPAVIQVQIPDNNGLIYIEDELIRSTGTVRQLLSPPLPPGKDYALHLRGAFKSGDKLLIEEKMIAIRAGQTTSLSFDGSGAVAVFLP
jgi:uncharacterized protein (TIGR03000 family)